MKAKLALLKLHVGLSNLFQLLAIWTGRVLPSGIPRATSAGWDRCTSAERDQPTTFCTRAHQLREPRSADERLQGGSVWIYYFFSPWEKHSAKGRSSICAQQVGFDCHRGAWNTPKQKSPTSLQGLKYTPETGHLKMAVRESQISHELQAWKELMRTARREETRLRRRYLGARSKPIDATWLAVLWKRLSRFA